MRTVRSRRRGHRVTTSHVLVGPAVLVAAVLGTAAVSVTGSRPVAALSAASVTSVHHASTARKVSVATPGWRVVARIGPAKGQVVAGPIAAKTSKSAWLAWTATLPGKAPAVGAVAHWTPTGWKQLPLPAKLVTYAQSAVGYDGDAGNDFWLFSSHRPTQALNWTGTAWRVRTIPSWVLQQGSQGTAVAVFGASNVWVFSLGANAYAARFNGQTWAKVRLPAVPSEVTALAAGDIWALGGQLTGEVALHWNGHTWAKIGIPVTGKIPDGFGPLTATGPRSAWVWRTELLPGPHTVAAVLHWNGTSWQRVAAAPADNIDSVAPDGAGGLWATGININPGGFHDLYHLTGGHWTLVATPRGVWGQQPMYLTWIPGSRSLWGIATGLASTGPTGPVIVKYGV